MGNLCASKESDNVALDDAEVAKQKAAKQRRRLSVKPEMVGDITKAHTAKASEQKGDDDLSNVEKKSKGDLNTCLLSNKGYVPYNQNKQNQDRGLVTWALKNDPEMSLFGVFDGHGEFGHEVAQFVIETLPRSFEQQDAAAIKENPEAAIKQAVHHCHEALKKSDIDYTYSGTTATFALKIGNTVWVGNAGDSRTVLAQRTEKGVKGIPLSEDNKPEQPKEKERILASGGRVDTLPGDPDEDLGPMRVWLRDQDVPGLAMSRSIGDGVAASVGVTSEPVVTSHTVEGDDLFIIWASDGVWEFISDQEAVDIVYKHSSAGKLEKGVKDLCSESSRRWRQEEDVIDDITALVLEFQAK